MIFLLCYNTACFSLVIFNLWSLLWLLFPTFSAFLWEVNQNNHSEEKKKITLLKKMFLFYIPLRKSYQKAVCYLFSFMFHELNNVKINVSGDVDLEHCSLADKSFWILI